MNKSIFFSIILCLSALTTNAELIYITAQGSVSTTYFNTVSAGTSVQYSFTFDTEQNGTFTYNDGSTYTYVDYNNGPSYTNNYFFADFQGSYVLPDNGIFDNSEYNIGLEYHHSNLDYQSELLGGKRNHYAYIYNYAAFGSWNVGTSVNGVEYNGSETALSNLTITGITNNVPEPSMFAIFISGMLFLGTAMVFRRRTGQMLHY